MVDTILVSQSPGNDDTDGSSTRSIGQRWQTSGSGKAVLSGRVWVPTAGLGTTALWQLWDTTGPTKIAEVDLTALPAPTPNTWMNVPLGSPVAVTASHNYIVCFFMDGASDYVWATGQSYPTGSGGTVTSDTSLFKNNGTSSQAPDDDTFTGGLFFTDVNVDDAPSGVPVGTAHEVDVAHPIAAKFVVPVGTAHEVDSALPIGAVMAVAVGTAHEIDTALPIAAKFVVPVGTAHEIDVALPIGVAGGGGGNPASGDDLSVTYLMNMLAGTLDAGAPTLSFGDAVRAWASQNGDISLIEALNIQDGNTLPNWLALQGVFNSLAGTTDLSVQACLTILATP